MLLSLQVVLTGSQSSVLLEGLSSQTLYHVSIFPFYDDGVGLALRGTFTTCKSRGKRERGGFCIHW